MEKKKAFARAEPGPSKKHGSNPPNKGHWAAYAADNRTSQVKNSLAKEKKTGLGERGGGAWGKGL